MMQTRTRPNVAFLVTAASCMVALQAPVAAQAPAAPAKAASEARVGTIVGIVTDAAKVPVPHATITAVLADGTSVRGAVSGGDGVYSLPDLPPGAWSITFEAEG